MRWTAIWYHSSRFRNSLIHTISDRITPIGESSLSTNPGGKERGYSGEKQRKEKKMNFWDKIRRDVQRGLKEGLSAVKEGAAVAREKAEELTAEGARR